VITKLFIGILLIAYSTFADKSCLEIEGLKLGCVTSVDHSCYRNVAIPLRKISCKYTADPSTAYRAEGAVAFNCKSSKTVKVCEKDTGNGDQIGEKCTTRSECLEFYPPTCKEECVPCFEKIVSADVGWSAGCIICTRKPCPDEEPFLSTNTCPYYLDSNADPEKRLTLNSGLECSSMLRCPSTAIVPSGPKQGEVVSVVINRGSCEKPKMPKYPEDNKLQNPKLCLWKDDERGDDISGEPVNNRSNCSKKIACKNSNYPNTKETPCEER